MKLKFFKYKGKKYVIKVIMQQEGQADDPVPE